jgi:hypothetical protein
MLNLQKELLETYEQASRAWLDRVRSEVELWSRLGEKLTATRSVPEAMDAYQKCVGERMHMAAEDGKRLFNECQNITQKIAGSLNGGGWPGRTCDPPPLKWSDLRYVSDIEEDGNGKEALQA